MSPKPEIPNECPQCRAPVFSVHHRMDGDTEDISWEYECGSESGLEGNDKDGWERTWAICSPSTMVARIGDGLRTCGAGMKL